MRQRLVLMFSTASFLNLIHPKKADEVAKKYNLEQKEGYFELTEK